MGNGQKPFITDDTQVQTETHDARMAEAGDQFSSKLQGALGLPPLILTKFDRFMNWVRGSPMFMLQFDITCCNTEIIHTYSVEYSLDRFVARVPRASSRRADMAIVLGTIVLKFTSRVKRAYDQMPEPKFVVGMESCTISGGPFQRGCNIIGDVGEVTPVDIHTPGYPPHPEAPVYGIVKLQKYIASGEPSPVTAKPYELEQFDDLEHNEIVGKLAEETDEEDLIMWCNWAGSP